MILVKNGPNGDFYIGQYPVTQAQWLAVMHYNPSHYQGSDLPVDSVSWDDAYDFINKLNNLTNKQFRLPKGSGWEYAACGGVKSKGFKYSGSNNIDEVAWYDGNSGKKNTSRREKTAKRTRHL